MMNNTTTLIQLLEQELSWVEQLNELLNEEKISLSKRQFNQLEPLSQKKEALSQQLENSAQKRKSLDFNAILNQANQEEAAQLNRLNQKLAEQLIICRELNMVNGQVIAHSLYARQEIVNILSDVKDPALYNAKGALNTAPKNNHHQKA